MAINEEPDSKIEIATVADDTRLAQRFYSVLFQRPPGAFD